MSLLLESSEGFRVLHLLARHIKRMFGCVYLFDIIITSFSLSFIPFPPHTNSASKCKARTTQTLRNAKPIFDQFLISFLQIKKHSYFKFRLDCD